MFLVATLEDETQFHRAECHACLFLGVVVETVTDLSIHEEDSWKEVVDDTVVEVVVDGICMSSSCVKVVETL